MTFMIPSVLRVRVWGDLLVLLEHGVLQPGLPADSLDQGAQAPVQEAGQEERQGLGGDPPGHTPHPTLHFNNMSFWNVGHYSKV